MTPIDWVLSRDTGISSETIWGVMMGATPNASHHAPHNVPSDAADFGRCYRLLQHFPEWRERMQEVATAYPRWAPLVREWDRLTEIYERGLETNSPALYDALRALEEEIYAAVGMVRVPWGWTRATEESE